MRKLVVVVVLVAATFVGVTPAVASHSGWREDAFRAALHSEGIIGMDREAVRLARATCHAIKRVGPTAVAEHLGESVSEDRPVAPETVGFILGAGVAAFCPRYTYRFSTALAAL